MDKDLPQSLSEEESFFEKILGRYRNFIFVFFIGLILVGLGVLIAKNAIYLGNPKIEVLESPTEEQKGEIITEIAGEVERPGVYKLSVGSRVDDLLIAGGGITADADRVWMEKSLNRAAKLSDGQKLYIPAVGEEKSVLGVEKSGGYQTISTDFSGQGSGNININTASQKELEALDGIGPVYAQNIIEHRPYSNTEELVSRGVLKKHVFEKIKDKITVF